MILFFLFRPAEAFEASSYGLMLWFRQILPTLLPFSILSDLVLSSNLFPALQRFLERKKIPCGPIPPEELFVIGCGFLFGFPIGSKLASDLCENGDISKRHAQMLCAFTNNLSPVFVSGFVCSSLFRHNDWILPTYLILYGPPFIIGILWLLIFREKQTGIHKKPASRFQINMQILDAGIIRGFETLIKLCGYIILFSIGVSMLSDCTAIPPFIRMILIGNTEVSNGITMLADFICTTDMKYILMIQFLSTGGLSGIAQTGSMIHHAGLSLKHYVMTKLIFVLCSTLLAAGYRLLL